MLYQTRYNLEESDLGAAAWRTEKALCRGNLVETQVGNGEVDLLKRLEYCAGSHLVRALYTPVDMYEAPDRG